VLEKGGGGKGGKADRKVLPPFHLPVAIALTGEELRQVPEGEEGGEKMEKSGDFPPPFSCLAGRNVSIIGSGEEGGGDEMMND